MIEARHLEDLPNELLQEILSKIPHQSQLAKVALLSKHFQTLVEPLLYRNIDLDVRYTAEDLGNTKIVNGRLDSMVPSFERFDRLIHTLSTCQDLSERVLTLSLKVEHRLWYQNSAAHFRLLKQVPQLRALSFSPPPLNLSIPDGNRALTSLRLDFSQVTDHYWGVNGWLSWATPLGIVAKQLWLPGLCKLQVDETQYIEYFDFRHHFPREKLGTSTVTDLRLLKCSFDMYDDLAAEFLRSIKCLKRFVIEISSPLWGGTREPGSGVFEHGLLQHQNTIEELAIAISQTPYLKNWVMGSFTQWSSLRRLAVPSYMIPSTAKLHEILPPLLEAFQLEHPLVDLQVANLNNNLPVASWNTNYKSTNDTTQENNLANLYRLADSKESFMPRLEQVVWWFQAPTGSGSDDPVLLDLALAFQKTRIKFEFVSEMNFKDTPFGKRLCEWR